MHHGSDRGKQAATAAALEQGWGRVRAGEQGEQYLDILRPSAWHLEEHVAWHDGHLCAGLFVLEGIGDGLYFGAVGENCGSHC